jgi:hypothetical protein
MAQKQLQAMGSASLKTLTHATPSDSLLCLSPLLTVTRC